MTARVARLITGARALAESPQADLWVRDLLRPRIAALPADAVLIAGDASGPDDWATAMGAARGLVIVVYDKYGFRTTWRSEGRRVVVLERREWAQGLRPETSSEWKAWLLRRDRVMVAEVARAHHAGKLDASGIAFFAPWAKTFGTGYTKRLAEDARLYVEPHICPDEFAPPPKARA